jgi:methylase of polypeptide subunit release factors
MSTAAARPEPSLPEGPAPELRIVRVGDLDIRYDERVLRPRPWTTGQAAWAAELLESAAPGPVLELCTGAGQIGLLAIMDNDRRLVAVDADPVACGFARRNAADAGLADRVEVRHAELEAAVAPDERFPVIIADPPWVPSDRTAEHPDDPPYAIDGGPDGLALARRCVRLAAGHLTPGGALLLQLGSRDQAAELEAVLVDQAPALRLTELRQPSPTGVVACIRSGRRAS